MRKTLAVAFCMIAVALLLLVSFWANSNLNSPVNSTSNSYPQTDPATTTITPTPQPQILSTPSSPPPGAIIVPDDYPTISSAVLAASDGQAIFVRAGQYNESVTVNKSVWLIGENQTLIDAHSADANLLINHDNVNVTGFILQNTPTPATGSWIEQMQGIGLSKQSPNIQIVNAKECNIYANNLTNSATAVSLENSSQNTVANNQVFGNGYGVDVKNSTGNLIVNNTFVKSGTAVFLKAGAFSNSVLNNRIADSTCGIYMDGASGNTLKNNTLTHNLRSFGVTGNDLSAFVNAVDDQNTIDGKSIYYLVDKSNVVLPSDAAYIALVNCVNITVQNSVLPLGFNEITLVNTNNSMVQANSNLNSDPALLSSNYMPQPPMHIFLYRSNYNNLLSNQGTILLNSSYSNTLTGNRGVMNLADSDDNKIVGNSLHSYFFDVAYGSGIALDGSCNNLIKQNTIDNNIGGSGILLTNAANGNIIVGNSIERNVGGITIVSSQTNFFSSNPQDPRTPKNNTIYGNTITANQNQGIHDLGLGTRIIGNILTRNFNWGIQLSNSEGCTIIGNTIDGLNIGVFGNGTRNTLIAANNITRNSQYTAYSAWLVTAYPVTFYHNNFYAPINFSHFADNYKNSTVSDSIDCIWDNGSQGNYWNSYSGVDLNGDGIGDTPNPLGFGFSDNYPLMNPYDIYSAIPPSPA